MSHAVVLTPEAEDQLAALYRYIAQVASPQIAERYTSAIVDHCEGLADFPQRGYRRDDIRPGYPGTQYTIGPPAGLAGTSEDEKP